jgi:hypothetical protein
MIILNSHNLAILPRALFDARDLLVSSCILLRKSYLTFSSTCISPIIIKIIE